MPFAAGRKRLGKISMALVALALFVPATGSAGALSGRYVGFGVYIVPVNGDTSNARVNLICEASARGGLPGGAEARAETTNIRYCRFTSPNGGSVNAVHVIQPGPEAWAIGTGSVRGPTWSGFTLCMGATVTYFDGSKISRDDCNVAYILTKT